MTVLWFSCRNRNSYTQFTLASSKIYIETVEYLKDKWTNVDKIILDNNTPLIIFTSNKGCTETVKILINDGVNVNENNENGDTPLMISIYQHKNYILK